MERLQEDSPNIDLVQHQQTVLGALNDATTKGESGKQPAVVDSNPLATKLITSVAAGSKFSLAMFLHEELSSSKKNNSLFVSRAGNRGIGNSLFVGGGGGATSHAENRHQVALVPMSYGEKKRVDKDRTLFERSSIASMSLTGTSSVGGKPTPIKGATIKGKTIDWLRDELTVVNRVLQNPYAKGTQRLVQDLARGVENASNFAQRNRDTVRNVTTTKL
ncbi:MAG: hypothetical protein HY052_00465 [Proteobacteria bacterium]|nr:hypothetical protein [Pseudomonadota bacterium]